MAEETVKRSIVKTISWRIVATIITACLVLAMTGEIKFAATVGALDTLIKFVAYFAHERTWNKIRYGKQ